MSSLNRKRHKWILEPATIDGERVIRNRCSRCAILATWAGAAYPCDGIDTHREDPARCRERALKSYRARKNKEEA